MNVDITSKEDVRALGLERGAELIMLQLIALRESVDEKLADIYSRLRKMEGGASGDDEEGRDGSQGSDEYEDWNGWD